jgi:hypothetical protein
MRRRVRDARRGVIQVNACSAALMTIVWNMLKPRATAWKTVPAKEFPNAMGSVPRIFRFVLLFKG